MRCLRALRRGESCAWTYTIIRLSHRPVIVPLPCVQATLCTNPRGVPCISRTPMPATAQLHIIVPDSCKKYHDRQPWTAYRL